MFELVMYHINQEGEALEDFEPISTKFIAGPYKIQLLWDKFIKRSQVGEGSLLVSQFHSKNLAYGDENGILISSILLAELIPSKAKKIGSFEEPWVQQMYGLDVYGSKEHEITPEIDDGVYKFEEKDLEDLEIEVVDVDDYLLIIDGRAISVNKDLIKKYRNKY